MLFTLSYRRLATSIIGMFCLAASLLSTGPAFAQAGLTEKQVRDDIARMLAEATDSMVRVTDFKVLSATQLQTKRYQVDTQVAMDADEVTIVRALNRAESAAKLNAFGNDLERVQQQAEAARAKDGDTESIRVIYQQDRAGAWRMVEVSDVTSEYAKSLNQSGPNSAPQESQVIQDFNAMFQTAFGGTVSIRDIAIIDAAPLAVGAVKMEVKMKLAAKSVNGRNQDLAQRMNGVINNITVIYQRDAQGTWAIAE